MPSAPNDPPLVSRSRSAEGGREPHDRPWLFTSTRTTASPARRQVTASTKEQPRWQRMGRSPGLLLSHPERVLPGACFATNRGARTLAAGACFDDPAVVSSDARADARRTKGVVRVRALGGVTALLGRTRRGVWSEPRS